MAVGTIALTSENFLDGAKSRANSRVAELLVAFTASADLATIPTLSITDYPGWMIYEARVNPDATAPTDGFDVTLVDNTDGIDIAEGQITNCSSTTSERYQLANAPIIGNAGIALTIAGNLVNSAVGTITLLLARV